MCSNTEQQRIELLAVARLYEQSDCVEMIKDLLDLLTPDQVQQMHSQQAIKCYGSDGAGTTIPLLVLKYFDGKVAKPTKYGFEVEKLKALVNETWYQNCAGFWVCDISDDRFYIIEPAEETQLPEAFTSLISKVLVGDNNA